MTTTVVDARHRLSHVAAEYANEAVDHGGVRISSPDDMASLMALFLIGVQYGSVLAHRSPEVAQALLAENDGQSVAAMTANLAFVLGTDL